MPRSSDLAAVERQAVARDVRAARREQEERGPDDVVERPEPAGGMSAAICARISSVGKRWADAASVSTGPGAIAFTRMPSGAHSTASVLVRFQTPALAAAECAVPGLPVQA